MTSCNEEELIDNQPPKQRKLNVEESYMDRIGELKEGKFFGEPVTYEEINGEAIFQGDIILTPEQLAGNTSSDSIENGRSQGAGRNNRFSRWPYNVVFFTIDPRLPNKERVYQAIEDWKANTNIHFYPAGSSTRNYITFRPGSGCSSSVGMVGGQQFINLALECDKGAVIHEIGHAVGLWHEQSRTDRNNFIRINYANILPGKEHNFQTYLEKGTDGYNRGNFDFGSIMIYHPYSFSRNGLPTITRLDGSVYLTQSNRLSAGDITIINEMYPALPLNPYNLGRMASRASWSSGRLITTNNSVDNVVLRLNSPPANSIEGAVLFQDYDLENRTKQPSLHMHPRWVSNGTVKGWYPKRIIPEGATFISEAGFVRGATSTDGVAFQVWVRRIVDGRAVTERVARVHKRYTGRLITIRADLSHLAGQEVSIGLRVDAGLSSGRDWAVWVNPRIIGE